MHSGLAVNLVRAAGFGIVSLAATCAHAGEVDPPAPFGACPTPAQVAWHELEFYGFIHFTTNTFTDKEWGYGDESPAIFNPSQLEPAQWARVAKDAGMRGLILTAKHHDGFCLWPTKLTPHSVASSPYKGGQGDVVGEFADAARAEGLKVGLYLSPWDRNHADYGKPEYIDYYRGQWSELISSYGPLFEVWFDGANGGDGYYGGAREARRIERSSYYRWEETNQFIEQLNPGVIIFSDAGPGCRWVGNESGFSDETSWQTINLAGMYPGVSHDHLARGDKNGTHWVGVEVDVSIRPGWFWHEHENDKVKTPEQLVEIYYQSVGRGANLLLNVPPDRRGLIHENDIASLQGMRRILDNTFKNNLLADAKASSEEVRGRDAATYGPQQAIDADRKTYWATDDAERTASMTVELPASSTIDVLRLREAIELGQRVEEFSVDFWSEGEWKPLAGGATIGPCRLLRFDPVTTTKLRLRITRAMAAPLISEFSAFKRPSPGVIR
ncbi:MAG TPA: alpha-L-fucosidase [Phycisphaerales bacterium]|nr:alpha-L-fucosidase [Phycisphaerales bacterium]